MKKTENVGKKVKKIYKELRDLDYTYREILDFITLKHGIKHPETYIETKGK